MVTALDKFYEVFDNPRRDDLFFFYDGLRYRLSFCGYIFTENADDGENEREYGFAEQGKALFEAVLDSKVNRNKDKSIREILIQLPPKALRLG